MSKGKSGARFNVARADLSIDYTPRQQAILFDDIPVDEIRTTELVAIMKKATARADQLNYDIAAGFYDLKMHPCDYMPHYTAGEAKALLQELTPWEIHWDTDLSEE